MRIPIRYGNPWRWILPLFLLPARLAYVRIDGDLVRVRMSWAFRLKFSKGTITSVTDHRPVVSIGAHGQQDRLDGLTVSYEDAWFNVRPSNTEPYLRLNLEATTEPRLADLKRRLLEILGSPV